MSFVQVIKLMFITGVMVFLGSPSFGQLNFHLLHDYDKILREKINNTKADSERVKAELDLSQLYLCAGIINRLFLDSTKSLNLKAEALAKKLNLTNSIDLVLEAKAVYYLETGDFKTGGRCLQEEINNKNKEIDSLKIAEAWRDAGNSIPAWSNALLNGRVWCFQHAFNILKKHKDKQKSISVFKDIADAHLVQGKYDLAEKELFQVLSQYKAIHFKDLYDTYFLISQMYHNRGDMHQALFYGLETIKNVKTAGDGSFPDLFYLRLSNTYEELGMYEEAIFYYRQVLYNNPMDKDGKAMTAMRIANVLIKENKKNEAFKFLKSNLLKPSELDFESRVYQNESLAISYLSLGQYKLAGIHVGNMLKAAADFHYQMLDPLRVNISVYDVACKYFLITRQFLLAKYYLRLLQEIPSARIRPFLHSDMEMYQSKIDSAGGKYASALKHFQTHKFLSDSLFNATKSNQIEELQISYATRQKDDALTLLKKKSQIQQASIASKNLVTNFMIIGFVLLAIIIAGLYNRYLVNKRYNTVLEGTQQEIAAKNIYLEKLLADNEWLLREVHHRVKNNMHVIMGLLQSQSAYLEDGVALNAVRDSRNRVQSMALIHQKLYMTTNATEIYLPEFVTELVDNLKDSFDIGHSIYFNLDIAPLIMDASYVVPLGLILNEAITNTIKHAFPYGGHDAVTITLVAKEFNEFTLTIRDNGKGISPDSVTRQSKSFGLQLISGLVLELGGTIIITGPPGTTLSIYFKTVHADRPS